MQRQDEINQKRLISEHKIQLLEIDQVQLFFDSIKSKETRNKYFCYLRKYRQSFEKDPLSEKDPKIIGDQIIQFINSCKKKGMSYGAIHNYVTVVVSFYKINDVILNTIKIAKFLPEQRKVKKDRAYTHEEILRLLEGADERMKVVILLLASTGMRIGALPSLKIASIQGDKITIYENDREEYFTFITTECKKAIDSYLDMRSRYGEKLTDNSPLIREQFDIRDKFAIPVAKGIGRSALIWKLEDIARRSGVRTMQVPIAHGFRKFYTNQLIKSNVKAEVRLRLEGHSIGITDHYWRPSEEDMYLEYQKATNALTINEENRLKNRIEKLEVEKSQLELLTKDVEMLKRKMRNK